MWRGLAIAEVAPPAPAAPGCRCRRCRSRSRVRPATRSSTPGMRLQQRPRLRRARPARAPDGRRRDTPRGRQSDAAARAAARARPAPATRRAPGAERVRARRPGRIVGEQLPVVLHRRPATGGVDHDAIDAGLLEHLDRRRASARACSMCPGVQRQRAAAALRRRRRHLAPFGRQHADGGLVDVPERQPLHAAGQHRHLHALAPLRRRRLGQCWRTARRASPAARRQRRSQPRQQSLPADRRGRSAPSTARTSAAHQRQRQQRQPHAPGIRNHRHQRAPEPAIAGRPRGTSARSARACAR